VVVGAEKTPVSGEGTVAVFLHRWADCCSIMKGTDGWRGRRLLARVRGLIKTARAVSCLARSHTALPPALPLPPAPFRSACPFFGPPFFGPPLPAAFSSAAFSSAAFSSAAFPSAAFPSAAFSLLPFPRLFRLFLPPAAAWPLGGDCVKVRHLRVRREHQLDGQEGLCPYPHPYPYPCPCRRQQRHHRTLPL
jgi:hypothetical protein